MSEEKNIKRDFDNKEKSLNLEFDLGNSKTSLKLSGSEVAKLKRAFASNNTELLFVFKTKKYAMQIFTDEHNAIFEMDKKQGDVDFLFPVKKSQIK